jgi:hypothetical protein
VARIAAATSRGETQYAATTLYAHAYTQLLSVLTTTAASEFRERPNEAAIRRSRSGSLVRMFLEIRPPGSEPAVSRRAKRPR